MAPNAVPAAAHGTAAATPSAACTNADFEWPSGSGYCWIKRDSGGALEGPGPNIFRPENVAVTAADVLELTVSPAGGTMSSAEVFLEGSLGLGDYIFLVGVWALPQTK